MFTNHCLCRQCQQQTGSTGVVNAFFETERVEVLSGDLGENRLKSGSGGDHVIVRCTACGTALWSHYPGMNRQACALRVGTLDDSASIAPEAVIFASERMPWMALPEGIPAFETTYDFREVLPPDRLDRLRATSRKAREGA